MADYGHRMTEYELAELEKRIALVYSEAKDDLEKTITNYFKTFARLDEKHKEQVAAGEMTQQEYTNWRMNAMARGKRYEAMRDKVAARMTEANTVARAYVEDKTPGIYALNRNYAAYTIEKAGAQVDFILFDEATVRRLIVEDPDSMPYYDPAKALNRGIDLAYGKKQITKTVTSSILQGKSIPKIADDLQAHIVNMDRNSSIRAARTAVTSAENAGRVDTYKAAEDMGIEMEQEWLATLDHRTRHSHRMLDGERIKVGGVFSNGCRFPGDPKGPPEEVYNCRCTLIAAVKGYGQNWARRSKLGGQTYEEWRGEKEKKKQEQRPDEKLFSAIAGIPADFADGMRSTLEASSYAEVKEIYAKYHKDLKCLDSNYKRGAFFQNTDGGIRFNAKADAEGRDWQKPFETVFHEFGHNIDWLIGGKNNFAYASNKTLRDGLKLGDVIKADYRAFQKSMGAKSARALLDMLKAENIPLIARGNISDVLEGVMGVKYPLGMGHGVAYHKRPGATEREFFAEVLSSAVTNPDSFAQMKRIFPNAVQMVFDIIGGDIK